MKLFKFIQRGKAKCGVEVNGTQYSVAKYLQKYGYIIVAIKCKYLQQPSAI